ncbi:MAG: L-rhamnose mutarotase [Acidobacteriaceae bacterium]
MRRVAQIIQLNAEDEAAYVRYHASVWPAVLATIAECNISNYSIFLRNGLLFSYFEYHGVDYEKDMAKMAACHDTQHWWTIMDPMQRPVKDASPGEKWSEMSEVFHFDPDPPADSKTK